MLDRNSLNWIVLNKSFHIYWPLTPVKVVTLKAGIPTSILPSGLVDVPLHRIL